MAIERCLRMLQGKIANYLAKKSQLKTNQKIEPGRKALKKGIQGLLQEDVELPGTALLDHDEIKERDETIQDLRETIELMELKMKKLE